MRTPRSRRSRRRRWLLLAALPLILLALLRDCSCSAPPAPAPVVAPSLSAPVRLAPPPPPPPTPPPPPAPELTADPIARRDRPDYEPAPTGPLPWIASFRRQVSARSPRLASCFVGASRPGSLKWTASVEPIHGLVSEHTLEPTLLSDALTQKQRACVVEVLSDPPYRLTTEEARATPSRIAMVIEF